MKGAWSGRTAFLYNRVVADGIKDVYEAVITQHLPAVPDGARILDVGCGPGHGAAMIARRFPRAVVTGVDLSERMVNEATKNARDTPNLAIQRGDAMALPFIDGSFDLCVTSASIKHWPDATRGVREMRRVLAPGGRVFVLEADRDATREASSWFVAKWRWIFPGTRGLVTRYFHQFVAGQGLDADELRDLLEGGGFRDVKVAQMDGRPFVRGTAVRE